MEFSIVEKLSGPIKVTLARRVFFACLEAPNSILVKKIQQVIELY